MNTSALASTFDENFIERNTPVLNILTQNIVEERVQSPWLVDQDVVEVYKALASTLKTLSSGIYYETLPEGPVRLSLFRRLKGIIDELMSPGGPHDALKVSDAVAVLDFLMLTASTNSNSRPKSRQYLDWLGQIAGTNVPSESARLIVP